MATTVTSNLVGTDDDESSKDTGTGLGKCRQVFATCVVTTGIFALGTVLAWTSPALPNLEETGDLGNITGSEKSWIGSTSMLGALASSPFSGYGVERFGRKNLMIMLSVPFIFGWCLIPWSGVFMMCVGRFITGFAGGGFSLAVPIFISEIAENHIRGILSSLFQLMMVLGILFIYVLGTYVNWRVLAYVSVAFPLTFLLLIGFVPETPRFYIQKNRVNKAKTSLIWYRGTPDVDSEFLRIQSSVNASKAEKIGLKTILSRSVFHPLLICLSVMVFEQLSGFNVVIFYTVDIFRAAGSNIDSNLSTIIIGVVQVFATVVSTVLVDKAGRRVLLLLSEVFMAISLFALGGFFYAQFRNGGVAPSGFGWVPISSLIVYIVAFAQGLGPLSWTLMGEILPPNLKGACSSIATLVVWFSAFVVTVSYEYLLEALGIYWCFWLYAILCVIGTFAIAIFVPETKGKSLEQIQSLFTKQGKTNSDNRSTTFVFQDIANT